MDRRTFAAAMLTAAAPTLARADAKVDRLLKELDQAKLEFGKGRAAAKKTALGKFDYAMSVVRSQPLKPTEKQGLLAEVESAKQRFDQQGQWPESADLVDAGFVFGMSLSIAYLKLSAAFERLVKAHQDARDTSAAGRVTDEKTRFESDELPGRAGFKAGAGFTGERRGLKKAIPFSFRVQDMSGPVFSGRVEQDMGVTNHPILKVKGSIDGIKFGCTTAEVVQGKVRELTFDGLVLGDRLLIGVGGIGSNGRAAGGIVTLGRKGKG